MNVHVGFYALYGELQLPIAKALGIYQNLQESKATVMLAVH